MADNYLEKKYQDYLLRKGKREKEKKEALRKKLEDYRRRIQQKK